MYIRSMWAWNWSRGSRILSKRKCRHSVQRAPHLFPESNLGWRRKENSHAYGFPFRSKSKVNGAKTRQ
jgi:hypothetical protein